MFAYTSKYGLALYEVVQKRGHLKRKWCDEFSVGQFRELLNVEKGKFREYKNLNLRVIAPAVLEVDGLGEFGCKVEPVYTGRKGYSGSSVVVGKIPRTEKGHAERATG